MSYRMGDEYNISSKSIIANPGTYVYMSPERRVGESETEFAVPDINCSDYNEWSFGLEDLYVYPSRAGADQIREWYSTREVVYLLGQNDNDPNASTLPRSCRAMTLGNHRYERGRIYYNHIVRTFDEEIKSLHFKVEVPGVGHSNFDIYNSEEGQKVLFDEAPTSTCSTNTSTDDFVRSELSILPNPALTTLRVNLSGAQEIKNLQIIDLQGTIHTVSTLQNEIELIDLPSGVFWVRVFTGDQVITSKFIKI